MFSQYLPQTPGWLANWQLFIAVTAFFNTVQNYTTLKLTRRIYSVAPITVTPLQARTFGIWTLTSAVVRAYAAYNINNKPFVHSIYGITEMNLTLGFMTWRC
ncbi:hypothetical protein AX15_005329 [Amanita polypyramis BW_CC]|nr:hypothetical protein AX15_005329 [Amanita polypyramis BW_CC]